MALAILWGLASRKLRDANPHRMKQHQKQENKIALAIVWGLASRKQRDANPHRMTQHQNAEIYLNVPKYT